MDFLLQVDANRSVNANDLVAANPGVRGHVTAGISDAHIPGIVGHFMLGTLQSRGHQVTRELLATDRLRRLLALPDRNHYQEGHEAQSPQQAPHVGKTAMAARLHWFFRRLRSFRMATSCRELLPAVGPRLFP